MVGWVSFFAGFAMCLIFFELIRKGFFQWAGKSRATHETVQKLMKQASHWALTAQQDKNDVLALIHINYAAGYAGAIKDIANDRFIYEATSIHFDDFEQEIAQLQEVILKRFSRLHTEIIPPKSILTENYFSLT